MTIRLLCCSGSLDGGGSERQLWQLVKLLPEAQFAKQLYLVYRRGVYLNQLPDDIPIHAFSDMNFIGRIPGSIHRAQVAHLQSCLRQQKIQVLYDRTYHMTLITGPACRRENVPRVSVIVSPPSHDLGRSGERFRVLKRYLLRKAYSAPNSVTLAVSQAVAEDAIAYFRLRSNQVQVLPNPVDVKSVQLASQQHQAEQTHSSGHFIVAVIGRMTPEKGHHVMLEVVKIWNSRQHQLGWRPIKVLFVGDGPLFDSLRHSTVQSGIQECIDFVGFQSNPYPFMARAGAICIPSIYEGLPNVALEAMALGRPLVSTNSSSSLLELIGIDNQRGWLVHSNRASEIADQLWCVATRAELAKTRCQAALSWVENNHSIDAWVERMVQLLLLSAA